MCFSESSNWNGLDEPRWASSAQITSSQCYQYPNTPSFWFVLNQKSSWDFFAAITFALMATVTHIIHTWQIEHARGMDVWSASSWGEECRAGMASGVQGSRGATLPVDCVLNPCWLLHWCSHCSDLSSLPPRPLKTKEHHPKPDVSPDKSSLQSGPETFKVNERVMSQWVTFRRSGPTSSSGDDGACQRAGRSECGSNLGTSKNTVCYELADWLIDYCASCCCSPSSTWAITWADATD